MPRTLPRLLLRSPMISPMYSSGVVIEIFMMGSSRTGPASAAAFLNAREPAILKAISDESTAWKEPSSRVTWKSIHGNPPRTPFWHDSIIPFSTAGIYCLGIAPPTILLTNSKPFPLGSGSKRIQQSPNWPWPPVCFLCLPWTLIVLVMVSL